MDDEFEHLYLVVLQEGAGVWSGVRSGRGRGTLSGWFVGAAIMFSSCLFDPFVSSKHSGSGLGLALVAKIIGDHGGTIEFESLQGQTIFRVLLPLHEHQSEKQS